MKSAHPKLRVKMQKPFVTLVFILTIAAIPALAHAGLGDTIVNAAQAQAQGQTISSSQTDFTVYAGTQPVYEATVHQYVSNATGKVFAVEWSGPRMPNLKSLLGSYFGAYTAARGTKPISLHAMSITTPDLVMEVHGPNGNIEGRAWAPALVPSNVSVANIVK